MGDIVSIIFAITILSSIINFTLLMISLRGNVLISDPLGSISVSLFINLPVINAVIALILIMATIIDTFKEWYDKFRKNKIGSVDG